MALLLNTPLAEVHTFPVEDPTADVDILVPQDNIIELAEVTLGKLYIEESAIAEIVLLAARTDPPFEAKAIRLEIPLAEVPNPPVMGLNADVGMLIPQDEVAELEMGNLYVEELAVPEMQRESCREE